MLLNDSDFTGSQPEFPHVSIWFPYDFHMISIDLVLHAMPVLLLAGRRISRSEAPSQAHGPIVMNVDLR